MTFSDYPLHWRLDWSKNFGWCWASQIYQCQRKSSQNLPKWHEKAYRAILGGETRNVDKKMSHVRMGFIRLEYPDDGQNGSDRGVSSAFVLQGCWHVNCLIRNTPHPMLSIQLVEMLHGGKKPVYIYTYHVFQVFFLNFSYAVYILTYYEGHYYNCYHSFFFVGLSPQILFL